MARSIAAVSVSALLTGALLSCAVAGCASAEAPPPDDCLGTTSEALKTCAKGATISGIDVSYYQGNVSWSQVKSSGRQFAFVRVSDGLNTPDTKFAQNWPALKTAGLVRGAYQFFRPSQDAGLQAQMVIDKIKAAGGLKPGDLAPVLDLESADGLASSVVVSKAKVWLAKIEAAFGIKPIVYTAAFMSSVIGTNFGGYTLWVANYQTTCPTMPSGWTDWQFWQNSDSGSVPGVSGNVDTNFFNGTLAQLQTLTLKAAAADAGVDAGPDAGPDPDEENHLHIAALDPTFGENMPNDGSQGSTIGSGGRPSAETESAAVTTPCR